KISGNSCGRTGCRTEFSNPSTTSSITAATPGTRSSISRGKSCPSPAAIGQPQVTQSEDWYKYSAEWWEKIPDINREISLRIRRRFRHFATSGATQSSHGERQPQLPCATSDQFRC